MRISLRLAFYREYKNWEPSDVAKELGISTETYTDLEKGRIKVNGILAQKLSDLYLAPIEFFIIDDTPHYMQAQVIYTHCSFSGNGANGYVNHNNTDRGIEEILFLRKEDIKNLKQEIAELKQQNNRLIELLGERVKEDLIKD